jgi:DNA mismatch repair protein MutS
MSEPSTPLMRQYTAVKQAHPSALLFFRLGDFYEMFFEDAVLAARELEITLTARNREKGVAIPMCGVPYHAAEGYIAKLVRKGYKVAVCDQVEDPRLAKKLVRREVTRVVTPGTAADAALGPEENNFLAAMVGAEGRAGFAALDLSTGEFRATEFRGADAEKRIVDEIEELRPRELLYASSAPLFDPGRSGLSPAGPGFPSASTPLEDWVFATDHAIPLLENHFGVLSLEGFGLAGKPAAATAAGAILYYVRSTQKGALDHVDRIGFYERRDSLALDAVTVRNLELVEPLFSGGDGRATLYRSLDFAVTPMGKRLLRAWMLRPAIERQEIEARLNGVEELKRATMARAELRRALAGILDLERLLSRVTLETANPRDLTSLAASLENIPPARAALEQMAAERLHALRNSIDELRDLSDRIRLALVAEPPLAFGDGVVRAGADAELDELRRLRHHGKEFLASMEERERGRTGISSLKVRFNSVFGYYLEISKANLRLVPPDYERRQTLVNAERFTTRELKEYEAKILDAEEKIAAIERRIFSELRAAVAGEARRIRQTALALAEVDVLASFAHSAALHGYARPQFDDSPDLEIVAGRHPVIERQEFGSHDNQRFVANDLYMNAGSQRLLVVTGPNMGGKSTYLRQAALIVIMAQMGSFVPAERARLGIIDRVFTRIGASDSLARGRSTFMVEMTETAAILHAATPQSLVLLDEVGRGTSTYDGLAIAWAALEYLARRTRAKTLFATHYFELTGLEDRIPGIKNFHVSVKENPGGIVFLRKVEPGAADRSYGIEVAKLAGLPAEVIERAREVLSEHESEQAVCGHPGRKQTPQLTIFTPLSAPVLERLREVDLNQLTPLAALNLLAELKRQVE